MTVTLLNLSDELLQELTRQTFWTPRGGGGSGNEVRKDEIYDNGDII